MKLVTVKQMRDIERRAASLGVSERELMENAGRAAALSAARMLGSVRYLRINVLVGPGNNGGDGLVAARHLHDMGARVTCCLLVPRDETDPNLGQVRDRGIEVAPPEDDLLFDSIDLVVDALLGTGRARPLEGKLAELLDRLRVARAGPTPPALLSLDLPTGVDADTGEADPHAVPADRTVAFGFSKVGLHVEPGASVAGTVEVVDIGLPPGSAGDLPFELIEPSWVRAALPQRDLRANKGTFGRVMVVGGSSRYTGALALAAKAGLRSGAGLVTVACPESTHRLLAPGLWESTYLPLPDVEGTLAAASVSALLRELGGYDAVVIGPGLTHTPDARVFLGGVLFALEPGHVRAAVLDADALNCLAQMPRWSDNTRVPCILTPHPGEMARLLDSTIAAVQSARLTTAVDAAQAWGQVVALKGANTIVASPDGRARISPIATPALATAGTGDVLAGVMGSFVAQGMEAFDAAAAAVWVHARAGLRLEERLGRRGAIAGDLLDELPRAFAELASP